MFTRSIPDKVNIILFDAKGLTKLYLMKKGSCCSCPKRGGRVQRVQNISLKMPILSLKNNKEILGCDSRYFYSNVKALPTYGSQ